MPTLSIAFGDSVSDINVLGEQLYIIVAAMFRQYSSLSEYTFYFRSLGAAVKDQSLLNLVRLPFYFSSDAQFDHSLFTWKEIPKPFNQFHLERLWTGQWLLIRFVLGWDRGALKRGQTSNGGGQTSNLLCGPFEVSFFGVFGEKNTSCVDKPV